MNLSHPKKLLLCELRLIADMRDIKAKTTLEKDELFEILNKNNNKTYDESPFKSIILDIRSI